MTIEDLLRAWSGEAIVARYDRPTGTWIFVAIHSTALGTAMGGARLWQYPDPAHGLYDAMRLAEGMTYKWATIGFPLGGGKSVLAASHALAGAEREGLFERFGALIESLRGAYACGPDLGTTPEDMAVIARRTTFVHGVAKDGSTIDPGPYTALGVFSGMRAALRRTFGTDDVAGRTVLVQGVGDVGLPLARLVKKEGGRVLVSDVDPNRAGAAARELDAEIVEPNAVYTTPCDVYAPCAVGATLNADTIAVLECRIVAGSANNQLATPEDADRLHARGILYAPDYVVNAGGATALPLLGDGRATPDQVRERVRRFDQILDEIFAEAAERNESPYYAAQRRAERALATKRDA